jgi:hypothetical protein
MHLTGRRGHLAPCASLDLLRNLAPGVSGKIFRRESFSGRLAHTTNRVRLALALKSYLKQYLLNEALSGDMSLFSLRAIRAEISLMMDLD